MPGIKGLLREVRTADLQALELRGRAIECAGLIGEAVGVKNFAQDAREVVQIFIDVLVTFPCVALAAMIPHLQLRSKLMLTRTSPSNTFCQLVRAYPKHSVQSSFPICRWFSDRCWLEPIKRCSSQWRMRTRTRVLGRYLRWTRFSH